MLFCSKGSEIMETILWIDRCKVCWLQFYVISERCIKNVMPVNILKWWHIFKYPHRKKFLLFILLLSGFYCEYNHKMYNSLQNHIHKQKHFYTTNWNSFLLLLVYIYHCVHPLSWWERAYWIIDRINIHL